jgi:hypothetical protein
MEVIEYVEKLDNQFNSITKDYKFIYEYIHNYLNDGKITYNQLMDFEISLYDLSIQLNSLMFLFKNIQVENIVHTIVNNKENKENKENKYPTYNENKYTNIKNMFKGDKLDYVIDKTIFNFIPLLFIYFMIFDKDSILYVKDFIEKTNEMNNTNVAHVAHVANVSGTYKKTEVAFIIEDVD